MLSILRASSLVEEAEHHELLFGAHTGGAGLVGGVGAGDDGQCALDGRRWLRCDGQVGALRLEPVLVGDEGQGDFLTFRWVVGPGAARRSSRIFRRDLFLGAFLLACHAVGRLEPVRPAVQPLARARKSTVKTEEREWNKLTWICSCRPNWVPHSRTKGWRLAGWSRPAAWHRRRRWEQLKRIPENNEWKRRWN